MPGLSAPRYCTCRRRRNDRQLVWACGDGRCVARHADRPGHSLGHGRAGAKQPTRAQRCDARGAGGGHARLGAGPERIAQWLCAAVAGAHRAGLAGHAQPGRSVEFRVSFGAAQISQSGAVWRTLAPGSQPAGVNWVQPAPQWALAGGAFVTARRCCGCGWRCGRCGNDAGGGCAFAAGRQSHPGGPERP